MTTTAGHWPPTATTIMIEGGNAEIEVEEMKGEG